MVVTNILSIDLEDWHQLVHRRLKNASSSPSANVDRQLETLLALLDEHKVKATFFTLGMLAEARPELVQRVANAGHEIASHGYAHRRVYQMTRREFHADTSRGKALLESITGQEVCGYRAAEFSITRPALWALEVLAELGFEYDSSIFPIHHRRYGIADFDPRPARYQLADRRSLIEIPLATQRRAGQNVPFSGGGYFRLWPLGTLVRGFERVNATGLPVTTYFHPYEFDPERLDALAGLDRPSLKQRVSGMRLNWHQNLGRNSLRVKLGELLQRFRFTTFREYLEGADLGESRTLFSAAGR
ncbi:MAG: polysaccharide deacetylase family protein [Candidatus Koribacter versatilis]|uniref:Polysaccharide deacetylase family protein n=1 Tax=Candidatus Korobacter versatilis TaxID=658062 RepID=A0A932ENQ2_9BACT|nr:polysaccharide deacetylase family protein [Candidatus Koribacter versatilis]